MRIYTYIHISMCMCIHIHKYIYIYIYIYLYMYVCSEARARNSRREVRRKESKREGEEGIKNKSRRKIEAKIDKNGATHEERKED